MQQLPASSYVFLIIPTIFALVETLIPMLLMAWSAYGRQLTYRLVCQAALWFVLLATVVVYRTVNALNHNAITVASISAVTSILICLLCIPLVHALAELHWLQAVTYVCAGYTMQNLASGLTDCVIRLMYAGVDRSHSLAVHAQQYWKIVLLSCVIDAVVYAICYVLVVKPLRNASLLTITDYRILLLLASVLFAVIVFDVVIKYIEYKSIGVVSAVILRLVHMTICVFVLCIEYAVLSNHALTHRLAYNQALLAERNRQWISSKANREALQIQMHDLKHLLHHASTSPEVANASRQTALARIAALEAYMETGNLALDTVLSEKALQCQQHHIRLTTMVDNQAIEHLAAADIYVLFGNILDNAIEAAIQVPDTSQRIIAVKIRHSNHLGMVLVENSYAGIVHFKHNLPITTKSDTQLHGFGTRSIATIVEQYHGTVQFNAQEHIFQVSIILPLPNND